MNIIVGVIGGTGLDQDSSILKNRTTVDIKETPYGWASDYQAIRGDIDDVPVYIIARHGREHRINPSDVNYRANLWALVKQLGCTHIIATSACGSLNEKVKPGNIGILDQYLDFTRSRGNRSFYKVIHVEQKHPIDVTMQTLIEQACIEHTIPYNPLLTAVTIEGPRFSTKFESELFRSWNCDVVNMTSVPEVPLAAELGVIYGCILLVTDYDCWKDEEEPVNARLVIESMKVLAGKVRTIIPTIVSKIKHHNWDRRLAENRAKVAKSLMAE